MLITLGWKTICIDVMVVQGHLYFSMLLGCDYVYAMKVVVSTLFRVMYFPHDGKIVTIDQLSFVNLGHRIIPSHQTSLNILYVLVVPSPSSVMSLDSVHHVGVHLFEK